VGRIGLLPAPVAMVDAGVRRRHEAGKEHVKPGPCSCVRGRAFNISSTRLAGCDRHPGRLLRGLSIQIKPRRTCEGPWMRLRRCWAQ
jgi:hypothetical protein